MLIKRTVSDANFEHCAKVLLPTCIEGIRNLLPGDRLDRDQMTAIEIVAEVAQAFAEREYGKPRFRVPTRSAA